ncbi:MAG: PH domain-containing protein [Methanolobus sp.]|nr:PH domain-containing protein [Methanolobus sp.]
MSDIKRQHPVMIILEAVRSSVYMLPPVFVFLLSVNGDTGLGDLRPYVWLLAVIFIASFALSALRWYLYTYRYEDGYLHIKQGLVFKKERSIKKERVQTVNIRTGLLQRLLGVATVQIETAGGGMESELVLKAVKMEETHRIRSYLESRQDISSLSDKGSTYQQTKDQVDEGGSANNAGYEKIYETGYETENKAENETQNKTGNKTQNNTGNNTEQKITASYVVPLWNTFLAGATSGRFMLLFSFIAAIFSQFYPYIPENVTDLLIEQLLPKSDTNIFLIVVILLSLLLLSWLTSIIVYMVKYASFTIIRQNEYLRVSWGLIEQKEFTLKINRIQALSIQEGILRQPFGLCAINSEVAGGGFRDQDNVTIICPILYKREVVNFLERIIPEYKMPTSMESVPKRARKRYLFRTLGIAIILILPLQLLPYGWLGLLVLPPVFMLGLSRYRMAATSIDDTQLNFRFRKIGRYNILMMRSHVQSLRISSNPFQRRSDLSTISASVLSSPSGKTFHVENVDDQKAMKIWDWFSRN